MVCNLDSILYEVHNFVLKCFDCGHLFPSFHVKWKHQSPTSRVSPIECFPSTYEAPIMKAILSSLLYFEWPRIASRTVTINPNHHVTERYKYTRNSCVKSSINFWSNIIATKSWFWTKDNSVDEKNQLDVTFCILYFSSNSCSTCLRAIMCPSSGADDCVML